MRYCTTVLLVGAGVAAAFTGLARAETPAKLPAELAIPPTPSGQAVAEAAEAAPAPAGTVYESGVSAYFRNWFARSDAAKASEPHWIAPLATVTPRLEQQMRYDQFWQHLGNGANIDQFDSGKGLELIPTSTNEVLFNAPAYLDRTVKRPADGWSDWAFLTVKQRLLSANEQNGNYIVSVFLGLQAPSGNAAFTNRAWLVTPTLAAGWGIGDFDVQSTLGVALPTDHHATIGTALMWNTALQYHLLTYLWPEFETNLTHFFGGLRGDKTQLFLTPGLILGRFHLTNRVVGVIGGGYQFAVTPKLQLQPALLPTYDHAWILTVRAGF